MLERAYTRPIVSTEAQIEVPYEPHVGETRQYWRDIVLGINDGLVSVFLLVAGVVGGSLSVSQVLLTAVAGAVAGAVSMGAGEYLATKSQDEVLDSELNLERKHIKYHRDKEVGQLRDMLTNMGMPADDVDKVTAAFGRTDATLLEAMKAFEFGVVESERRSPMKAMAVSALTFLVGSATSVVPFLLVESTHAGLFWASAFTAVGLFVMGVIKTMVTSTSPIRAGLENLAIAGLGGVLAYFIGVGISGSLV